MILDYYKSWGTAKWIWPADARAPNTHVLFRKDFHVTGEILSATLSFSVETFARIFLNGDEVFRSSSLSYPGCQHYEQADLLPSLKPGKNELAIVAWYAGVGCASSWLKDPGLLAEVAIYDEEGLWTLESDASWSALRLDAWSGPARSRMFNLDLVEIADYRKLPEGFPFPTEMTGFEEPEVLPWAGVRMGVIEPRPFPAPILDGDVSLQLRSAARVLDRSAIHKVPALAVSHEVLGDPISFQGVSGTIAPPPSGQATTLIYQLGGYEKFFPRLELDAPEGTVVDFSWCEQLTDGHFDARPKHPWVADRYTLREGTNVIEPEEWKAGRFIQLTFRNFSRPVRIDSLRMIRTRYPLTQRVYFRSSDSRLDKIVQIGLRAAEQCMHDRIMDCPWRERRQWIADAQRIALVNYYAFDDQALIRGALRQHARLQDATGRMWVCVPLMEEYPVQSMEWARAIVEYTHYTGDQSLIPELADNVEWLHRWFLRCRDERGLFFNPHVPVMNWMDNPISKFLKHQFDTAYLGSNLRYLLFLDDVETILRAVGNYQAAAGAVRERAAVAARLVDAFYDSERDLLREMVEPGMPLAFSELSAALLVRARMPGIDAAAHWERYCALARHDSEITVPTAPFGKYETFEALGFLNRPQAIVDEIYKNWGPMVDAGYDTAWEWFDRESSACHGWSGIPIVALLRHVLHVDSRKPGVTRRENICGLDWMECEVAAAYPVV